MHIGHYAPRIWAQGGIATYIRRLGHAQSAEGHEVVYLSSADEAEQAPPVHYHTVSDDSDLFQHAAALNLDILHLHKAVDSLPDDRVPTIRTMHGHQGGCPSGSRYLARQGQPCDRAYSLTGCLWGHVVDRCGSVRPHRLASNFARIHQEIELASTIPTLTVSHFLREQMLRAGCPSDHLYTIPSPAPEVDHSFTPVPRDTPSRFVYLGRLVPQKGLAWLLRALAEVDTPVHLDVAGEGPQEDDMKTLTNELNIGDRVTFHGWVGTETVASLILEARSVVFPSVWHEPAGLVSLEAAAYGRPLIASKVGGIPEYALEEYATLVAPRDVEALTDAIGRQARNADRADQMGQQGYQLARSRFSMDRFLQRLRTVYGDVLEHHRSAATS